MYIWFINTGKMEYLVLFCTIEVEKFCFLYIEKKDHVLAGTIKKQKAL
jgi:hypothetical protein